MGRILTVLVTLITMATAAHATTLAGGAIFGGPDQNNAVCYLYNAGDSTVNVSGSKIVRQNSGPVEPLSTNNCDRDALAPGNICAISVRIVDNVAHACKFVISPDAAAAAVRGTLEVRSGNNVLKNAELR